MLSKYASNGCKALLSAAFLWSTAVSAIEPAQLPLMVGGQVEPNVMFILDDSGSMGKGFLPDSLEGSWNINNCGRDISYAGLNIRNCSVANGNWFLTSPTFNKVYYDPAVTYKAPLKPDGTRLSVNVSQPKVDGYNPNSPSITLSSYKALISVDGTGASSDLVLTDPSASGPFYYRFKSACNAASLSDMKNGNCFERVSVSDTQNFATWFSFYRNRMLAAKSGSLEAFMPLKATMRVGYGAINQGSSTVDGTDLPTVIQGVRLFDATAKQSFYNWLVGKNQVYNGLTPLRRALGDAGRYYSITGDLGPWSTTPGQSGGETYSCRQSYSILTTDGYWNSSAATGSGPSADVDGDGVANTLGDIGKYYWKTDLLPGVTNNVPTSRLNPQNQQHMVTFSVGLGLEGTLNPSPEAAFAAVLNNTESSLVWPDPVPTNTAVNPGAAANNGRLLDLLHAAVNSRGAFFSAEDPEEFANALAESLVSIADLSITGTPGATSSQRITDDTLLFTTSFDSSNWTGKVIGQSIKEEAGLSYVERWEAGSLIKLQGRNLVTNSALGAGKGVPMNWASVNRSFFANDEAIFDYIRGSRVNEAPNGRDFRARDSLLGDIVNSTVEVVGKHDFGYLSTRVLVDGYPQFWKRKAAEPAVVYVGANDGYLHAFSESGAELFAFMPYGVGDRISALADEGYGHRFYVDGKLHEHDVFIRTPKDNTAKWRTVLTGSLGAGGKSVYALDVTQPRQFSADNVLWEFTDADMGYSYSEAVVGLLNGTWVAMFGNGYGLKANGDPLDSILYVVDLATGDLKQKITLATKTGGLSSPGFTYSPPSNNRAISIDQVYVGDVAGNLWRLDAANNGTLSNAFGNNPLFKARSGTVAQPITVRPVMSSHPTETDTYMVYFGTGSFMQYADVTAPTLTNIQSIYGIWGEGKPSNSNNLSPISARSDLEQVKIVEEGIVAGKSEYRITEWKDPELMDWKSKAGWYLDLLTAGTGKEGERVVQTAEILAGRLFLDTLLPTDDPCKQEDNGWVMTFDLATGGRPAKAIFDYNGDGTVTDDGRDSFGEQPDPVEGSGIRGDVNDPYGGLLIGEQECYYFGVAISCGSRPTAKRVTWEQIDEE
ncbi:hypothetical protein KEM63_03340 [Halopseudomonas nanhaiensis]|uniref:pilus assembly protein n=1 Tax=Halopseudomonas nanhaiensis TaxID=2830842 RepID=UPI001CBD2BE8|nr:PilC/PilY family type IV pilus protein [Halopseudomonas nanhaiensis]UAW99023.1 hypothetical protein KEM63_03340 [Halopseudomonas nanhaiensis]